LERKNGVKENVHGCSWLKVVAVDQGINRVLKPKCVISSAVPHVQASRVGLLHTIMDPDQFLHQSIDNLVQSGVRGSGEGLQDGVRHKRRAWQGVE
jgi:hypothetical protein